MIRQAIVIKTSFDCGSALNRAVCIDAEEQNEIYAYIADKQGKFLQIVDWVLTMKNMYYQKYDKETINERTKNVTARA